MGLNGSMGELGLGVTFRGVDEVSPAISAIESKLKGLERAAKSATKALSGALGGVTAGAGAAVASSGGKRSAATAAGGVVANVVDTATVTASVESAVAASKGAKAGSQRGRKKVADQVAKAAEAVSTGIVQNAANAVAGIPDTPAGRRLANVLALRSARGARMGDLAHAFGMASPSRFSGPSLSTARTSLLGVLGSRARALGRPASSAASVNTGTGMSLGEFIAMQPWQGGGPAYAPGSGYAKWWGNAMAQQAGAASFRAMSAAHFQNQASRLAAFQPMSLGQLAGTFVPVTSSQSVTPSRGGIGGVASRLFGGGGAFSGGGPGLFGGGGGGGVPFSKAHPTAYFWLRGWAFILATNMLKSVLGMVWDATKRGFMRPIEWMGAVGSAAATTAQKVGAMARAVGTDAVGAYAEFEQHLNFATSLMGDGVRMGSKGWDELRKKVVAAGMATRFTGAQAARALGEIVQAGFDKPGEAISMLKPSLLLSSISGGEMNPVEAVRPITAAMHVMGTGADSATKVVDRLAATILLFNAQAKDMRYAVGIGIRGMGALRLPKGADPMANLEQMLLTFGLIRNQIPTAERAATATAMLMESFSNPKAIKAFKKEGIHIVKEGGKEFNTMGNIMAQVYAKMETLSEPAQRAMMVRALGSQRSMGGFQAVYQQLLEMVKNETDPAFSKATTAFAKAQFVLGKLEEKFKKVRAEDLAIAMAQDLGSMFEILRARTTDLSRAIGQQLMPVVRPVLAQITQGVREVTQALDRFPEGRFLGILGGFTQRAFGFNLGDTSAKVGLYFRGLAQAVVTGFMNGGVARITGGTFTELMAGGNEGVRANVVQTFTFLARAWNFAESAFTSFVGTLRAKWGEIEAAFQSASATLGLTWFTKDVDSTASAFDRATQSGTSFGKAVAQGVAGAISAILSLAATVKRMLGMLEQMAELVVKAAVGMGVPVNANAPLSERFATAAVGLFEKKMLFEMDLAKKTAHAGSNFAAFIGDPNKRAAAGATGAMLGSGMIAAALLAGGPVGWAALAGGALMGLGFAPTIIHEMTGGDVGKAPPASVSPTVTSGAGGASSSSDDGRGAFLDAAEMLRRGAVKGGTINFYINGEHAGSVDSTQNASFEIPVRTATG